VVEKKKISKEEEKEIDSKKTEKDNVKKKSAVSKGASDEILEKIEKMTVLELADLVKALEEKFGVTAAMPVAMPANAGGATIPSEAKEAEDKTDFEVILNEMGPNKIRVI